MLETAVLTPSWTTETLEDRGYDVCTFAHVPTFGEYFNCDRMWEAGGAGVTAAPFMGATIKIGFLNDATGPIAVYANGFVAAASLWVCQHDRIQ